jgi:hypothetical protein
MEVRYRVRTNEEEFRVLTEALFLLESLQKGDLRVVDTFIPDSGDFDGLATALTLIDPLLKKQDFELGNPASKLILKFSYEEEDVFSATISHLEVQTFCQALELLFRIGMGQMDEIFEHLPLVQQNDFDVLGMSLEDYLASIIPLATGMQGRVYYGIRSPKVSREAKLASDMYRIFRHRLAWDLNPDGAKGIYSEDPHISPIMGASTTLERVEE